MTAEHAAELLAHGALVLPSTDPAYRCPADLLANNTSYNNFWRKWPLTEAIVRSEEAVARLIVRAVFLSFSLHACELKLMLCVAVVFIASAI